MMIPPSADDWASTEWMKTLQSWKPRDVIFAWISCLLWSVTWLNTIEGHDHLLAITRFAVLALGPMNERRFFCVEAVEIVWLFIHKCVVLRHKLPAHFRRNDVGMNRVGGNVCHAGHGTDMSGNGSRKRPDNSHKRLRQERNENTVIFQSSGDHQSFLSERFAQASHAY
jgi:hypothetical protein